MRFVFKSLGQCGRVRAYPVQLPDFGKSFKIMAEPGFPHEFGHAEFNGTQKNQIQKYLRVAFLIENLGFPIFLAKM